MLYGLDCASIMAIGNCALGYWYIYKTSRKQWLHSLVYILVTFFIIISSILLCCGLFTWITDVVPCIVLVG